MSVHSVIPRPKFKAGDRVRVVGFHVPTRDKQWWVDPDLEIGVITEIEGEPWWAGEKFGWTYYLTQQSTRGHKSFAVEAELVLTVSQEIINAVRH